MLLVEMYVATYSQEHGYGVRKNDFMSETIQQPDDSGTKPRTISKSHSVNDILRACSVAKYEGYLLLITDVLPVATTASNSA